jgi:tRNA threonylcarbamoyladenosine biosynthesis protein TsaE
MYRLCCADELFDLGWEDYLARGGVCAVEWSENVSDALEDPIRVVIRTDPDDENRRIITITGGRFDAAAGL